MLVLAVPVRAARTPAQVPGVADCFYVDYRAKVPASAAGAFPLAILHPDVKTDLAGLHARGTVTLAYLNLGEMDAETTYRAKATQAKLPLLGRNEAWKSDIIDLTDKRWQDLLAKDVAGAAYARGFDGVFLDTADTLLAQAPAGSAKGKALREAIVTFVKRLRAENPGKKIVVNRGFEVLPRLVGVADGVMAESVFAGYNVEKKKCGPVAPEETKELLTELRALKKKGFAIYVLDYADPSDAKTAFAAAAKIRAEGFSALVSTPALNGRILAPWREKSRRVLTVYDIDKDTLWPEDTFTSTMVQLPLEWLGYDTDYLLLSEDFTVPGEESEHYAAIVIPRDLNIPPAREKDFVDWLLASKAAGTKIILFGGFSALQDTLERHRLIQGLGLKGDGDFMMAPSAMKVTQKTPGMTGFEVPVDDGPKPLQDVLAPPGSKIHLAYDITTPAGEETSVTPIFTTEWGGAALAPFISWQRPDFVEFWYLDPFAFLKEAMGDNAVPVADATTFFGLRGFLSHIDGDGFANRSSVAADSFTGDAIMSRVLTKYPLPVSVSVIEAEVRCLAKNLKDEDRPRLEELARTIFKLPNVEVASHAFSHPFIWIPGDQVAADYAEENLQLKFPYKINLDTEITGSIKYINETLAPPGKPVSLFLWTGNCRPGPIALRMVREAGMESLNGGDTLISALSSSVSSAAARSVPWGDELQVRAPMQNENVYTHLFTGTVRGSFVRLLQTFKMTENPRRLKPANLYYHFYSGDRADSLKAIETVCDWAMKTPLHPLKVSDYAKTVRDAAGSRLFVDAKGRWLFSGNGYDRTVRLPVAAGVPDIGASSGVIGHAIKDDQRYVSLTADPVRVITLKPAAARHAYVETSEAGMDDLVLDVAGAAFKATGWKPSNIVFAGFNPGAEGELEVDGVKTAAKADDSGRFAFKVAPGSKCRLIFKTPLP